MKKVILEDRNSTQTSQAKVAAKLKINSHTMEKFMKMKATKRERVNYIIKEDNQNQNKSLVLLKT